MRSDLLFRGVLLCLVLTVAFSAVAQNKHQHLYGYYSKGASQLRDSSSLSDKWEAFTVEEGEGRSERPKPYKPSYALSPETDACFQIETTPNVDSLVLKPVTSAPQVSQKPRGEVSGRLCEFTFYGEMQSITVPAEYGTFHPDGIAESDVATFWSKLERYNYSTIINELVSHEAVDGYNDWAVYKWVEAVSEIIFPKDKNGEREVFTAFILTKMGLMCRMARVSDGLTVLFASAQKIYARKFITLGSIPYYLTRDIPEESKLYTYRSSPSLQSRPFDMRLLNSPHIGNGETFHVKTYSSMLEKEIETDISTGLISFYEDYPQLDVFVYALGAKDQTFSTNLLECLSPCISGLSKTEALGLILSYCQADFEYINDFDQFGREKPMFCEESYFYPGNDCEDRSVLFSFLVSNLLTLKIILLDYDDHVCTAVRLDDKEASGAFVSRSDGMYFVCDPSFIGASVGMIIPEYRSRKPKVVLLN